MGEAAHCLSVCACTFIAGQIPTMIHLEHFRNGTSSREFCPEGKEGIAHSAALVGAVENFKIRQTAIPGKSNTPCADAAQGKGDFL